MSIADLCVVATDDNEDDEEFFDIFDDMAECGACGHWYCTCCGCDCWMEDEDNAD